MKARPSGSRTATTMSEIKMNRRIVWFSLQQDWDGKPLVMVRRGKVFDIEFRVKFYRPVGPSLGRIIRQVEREVAKHPVALTIGQETGHFNLLVIRELEH